MDIINPPMTPGNIESFCIPSIILWNPHLIHNKILLPGTLKCHCGQALNMNHWNDGTTEGKKPRILHAMKNVVYLVSAVYTCNNHHEVLAHDERLLKQLPTRLIVPFLLFHRTGITRCLADMIIALTIKGLNFYNIESLILEQRWEYFSRQQDMYEIDETSVDFFDMPLAKSPSNDIISKAFLATFLENEQLYLKELSRIPIEQSISFDHTFKVATNIGYLREDKKWITEYDGLLLVLNDRGQVVTWQLTKSTSISESETLLKNICERSKASLKTIYIDNCCNLRNKIKAIFGADVEVKLDLFHAVQRISKTLPKRHSLTRQCLRDLTLVFRSDGDVEDRRKSATPSSEIISSKLQAFKQKWKGIKDTTGSELFRSETFVALDNIEVHIIKGCLSNIPPGGGTNKNERFHQHLNSFFHRSKIGILLAYALLTVIIHAHNTVTKIGGKSVSRPITAGPLRKTEHSVINNIHPVGVIPKKNTQNLDHWEIDISESTLDLDLISLVLIQALKKLDFKRCLCKMGMATLGKAVCKFKEFQSFSTAVTDNQCTALDDLLKSYGLMSQTIAKDGNCFFKAIAANILYDINLWRSLVSICTGQNIDALAMSLRKKFVEELLGLHRTVFESFTSLSSEEYETECLKFLQDGFFANAIGDLMPIATATALQVSLVVFIDVKPHLMYVNPAVGKGTSSAFVIYHSIGVGHYDAAIPFGHMLVKEFPLSSTETSTTKQIFCSCGVNKSSQGISCSPGSAYATRCKCYKHQQKCTKLCRCKECKNPFGKEERQKQKRKREPHLLQVPIPSSKRFVLDRGEVLSESIWSDFETLVLEEILHNERILEDDESVDVTKLYNDIVDYSSSSFCTIKIEEDAVFRKKSATQIAAKIAHLARQPQ